MKNLVLIGGKLQGFEASYLTKKAGMRVVLVDKKERPLIMKVVDEFHCFDVTKEPEKLIELSKTAMAVLPVNENLETINFLRTLRDKLACPMLFDFDAYHISMDKKRSKEYFRSINVPMPLDNPTSPPYFIKPPCESSSIGTSIIYDQSGLEGLDPSMLIEEYVEGDVVSLEVVGDGERFEVVKETKIHIDGTYDCHMVTPLADYPEFRDLTYKLAENLNLKGIMDVEAIDSSRGLKVLEIDARFPSQTPTVVYHSSGVNLIELLLQAFVTGVRENEGIPERNYCTYEHLLFRDGELVPVGEHVLSQGTDYHEFHASEGLEIFECSGERKVFTLISWASEKEEADLNRQRGLNMLREYLAIGQGA
ncbi:MAG: 3-methylornithine--L-lysine ligase PylC [Methanolobus sp.]|uniref:3-methylornithine--L-lysine ligase PylC n=1 Tax=Methanolobus sp. TaxID=1874737 RepID=UPI0027307355|nr:3-methylornithine--L-lysine ligase PylC [Methanolobus sp.]MDP2216575.1 3-methylornithine--L-lysine ligase PylC [Methanolobus sp.]